MKELSIEQKAKAYDEALERARKLQENSNGMILKKWLWDIFPELKESEDEKIRKSLLEYLHTLPNHYAYSGVCASEWTAWLEKQVPACLSHDDEIMIRQLTEYFTTGKGLQNTNDTVVEWLADVKRKLEKQGEQKSIDDLTQQEAMDIAVAKCFEQGEQKLADNVEPKFKVGDWITNGDKVTQIIAAGTGLYIINRKDMSEVSLSTKYIEKWYHLWTIQDAQDGDVLVTDSGRPFIFKGCLDKYHPNSPVAYCGINSMNEFFISEGINWWTDKNVYPATKEQCDKLKKAMADAGYTFDFEKKELKKINSDLTEFENALADICRGWIGEELGWEDYIIKNSFPLLELAKKQFDKYEQKPTWSVEDENRINRLIAYFEDKESFTAEDDVVYANWLKSLKERHTWKPSDEHYELEEFAKIVRSNLTGISKAVQELFEAKYLQLTGNKMYGGFKD